MKTKLTLLFLMLSLFIAGCVVNPVTGNMDFMLVSKAQELEIGQQYAPEIEKQLKGRLDDEAIQNYVNSVGQSVAKASDTPDLEFTYTVVNHEMTNAMALPGGHIFITRGMLEKLSNESQLAAILAHETVHVTARHSASAMSRQIGMDLLLSVAIKEDSPQMAATIANMGQQLLGLKYSRNNEIDADQYGMDYLFSAGYNPMGMIETMEILSAENKTKQIEFLSTHPEPENRKDLLMRHLNLRGYNYKLEGLTVGDEQYQARLLRPLAKVPRPEPDKKQE